RQHQGHRQGQHKVHEALDQDGKAAQAIGKLQGRPRPGVRRVQQGGRGGQARPRHRSEERHRLSRPQPEDARLDEEGAGLGRGQVAADRRGAGRGLQGRSRASTPRCV
ncbi:hypothetical protein LTR39_004185, partial [Cryomyces antarcticus]